MIQKQQNTTEEKIRKRRIISLVIFIVILTSGLLIKMHTIIVFNRYNKMLAEKQALFFSTNGIQEELQNEIKHLNLCVKAAEVMLYLSGLIILTSISAFVCFKYINKNYAVNEKGEKLLNMEGPLNVVLAGVFFLMYLILIVYKNTTIIIIIQYLSLIIFIAYITTIGILNRKWTAFEKVCNSEKE